MQERRLKIMWVTPELLVGLRFFGGNRVGDQVEWTTLDLPADVTVQAVHYSPERDAFGFRLYHPSWDVVPDGNVIPDVRVMCQRHSVSVGIDAPFTVEAR